MPAPVTPITAALDADSIPYRVLHHREPVFTMATAARQRGVVEEEMVKSILLCDAGGRYVMACVLGDARLDPKAVRDHLGPGWRRLHFADADEIRAVTGCVQGAVAPLGLPAHVPVVFDAAIAGRDRVNISSGDPMAGLELAAADLIRAAGAQLADITASESGPS